MGRRDSGEGTSDHVDRVPSRAGRSVGRPVRVVHSDGAIDESIPACLVIESGLLSLATPRPLRVEIAVGLDFERTLRTTAVPNTFYVGNAATRVSRGPRPKQLGGDRNAVSVFV